MPPAHLIVYNQRTKVMRSICLYRTAEDFEMDTIVVFPTDGGIPAILTIQLPPSLRELSQDSVKILQAGEKLGKIYL